MAIPRICCSDYSPFSTPTKASFTVISLALVIIGSLALYGSFHPASMFGPLGHTLTSIGSGVVVGAGLLIFIFNVLSKPKIQQVEGGQYPSGPYNPPNQIPKPTDRGTGAPGESVGTRSTQHKNVERTGEEQGFEDHFG